MNKHFFLFVLLIFNTMLNAQTDFFIEGQIFDKDQKPLSGIQIVLLQAEDNSIVKIEISDMEGKYRFSSLKQNDYQLFVEDMDYNIYQSATIILSEQQKNLTFPPIIMVANNINMLDEVVVTKKRQFIENKIDRTVVNVDALITAAGGNAMEVLEKSPGISVDENGTITFKGKQGVQVFEVEETGFYR